MQKLSYDELMANSLREQKDPNPVASSRRAIEKDGHCYHVITQSWCKEKIFSVETATYRHNMLCRLCVQEGIVILFSVTMPTHTHEVFLTSDWKALSKVIRIVNVQVSRFIRNEFVEKTVRRAKEEGRQVNEDYLREKESRHRIFDNRPTYIAVGDIVYLMFLGKYIFENPVYLKAEGKTVPFSCFWMFEKNYFKAPYDEKIYLKLFGMSAPDLFLLYSTRDKAEVKAFAQERFKDWTKEDNARLFSR